MWCIMKRDRNYLYRPAVILTAVAIITSAFHFWPFHDSKIWQLLCPSNLAVLAWSVLLGFGFIASTQRRMIRNYLPHISIVAYLFVNVLSFAFSPDISRSVVFVIKLVLMFVGGYALFSFALSNKRPQIMLYIAATTSLFIAIAYCIIGRFLFNYTEFGFFDSGYKYGTYIGMLPPLCATFLILSTRVWTKLLAGLLIIGSFASFGSLGAVCASVVGLLTTIIFINKLSVRLVILLSLITAALVVTVFWSHLHVIALSTDCAFGMRDGLY